MRSEQQSLRARVWRHPKGLYGVQCPLCARMCQSPFNGSLVWQAWEVCVRRFERCRGCGNRLRLWGAKTKNYTG